MNSILINTKENILIKRMYQLIVILLISLIVVQTSCKKFVEVPPPVGSITENTVYASDATAISALTTLYSSMNTNPIQGAEYSGSIALFAGLSADEYNLSSSISSPIYLNYYHNKLTQSNMPTSGSEHWAPLYNFIFKCNAAIDGLSASAGLTPAVKQQLLGEAKFMRAFFYFYLVNLFGDVPLALATDPAINTLLPRTPKTQVYNQIVADLKEAISLLSVNYLDETLLKTTNERIRPTKWAAGAMLARVYLYTNDYANAEEQATAVINNIELYNLLPLNDVFLKNSREAIWQIQPTDVGFNTLEARTLIIPATGPTITTLTQPVYLSNFLLHSFESGDQRAVYGNWIDTTIYSLTPTLLDTVAYPYKYKLNNLDPGITSSGNMQEYFMVLRLAEQYLIRAEARAQQNNIVGAQSDLNVIRSRADLPNTMAGDKTSLLEAILHERQVELFSEWGYRWFDLKRSTKIDIVMSVITPQKAIGTAWQSYQQLYPLPLSELQAAPNLVQNPGY